MPLFQGNYLPRFAKANRGQWRDAKSTPSYFLRPTFMPTLESQRFLVVSISHFRAFHAVFVNWSMF